MRVSRAVAIWFGVGLMRPAPGTWGSAAALVLGIGLHRIGHFPLLALATILVTALGFWAVARETAGQADKDPSEIVVDEVAGQWLALAFPSAGLWLGGVGADQFPWPGWVAAFVLFRLFDIRKPWLVGRADRRHDAAGVMIDDLWAGLFAGVATVVLAALWHGFMRF